MSSRSKSIALIALLALGLSCACALSLCGVLVSSSGASSSSSSSSGGGGGGGGGGASSSSSAPAPSLPAPTTSDCLYPTELVSNVYVYTCPRNKDPYYVQTSTGVNVVVCCDQWDHNINPSGETPLSKRWYGNCSLAVDALVFDDSTTSWTYCYTGDVVDGQTYVNNAAPASCNNVPLFDNKNCLGYFRCSSSDPTVSNALANDGYLGDLKFTAPNAAPWRNVCPWMGDNGYTNTGWDQHWQLPSNEMGANVLTNVENAAAGGVVASARRLAPAFAGAAQRRLPPPSQNLSQRAPAPPPARPVLRLARPPPPAATVARRAPPPTSLRAS